jgi:dipeptidyl aminopeptidase/acylaminoacyl peptidase
MHTVAKSLGRLAFAIAVSVSLAQLAPPSPAAAQVRPAAFSIRDVLSPAFPYNLVAARRADRIAWIENERGMRNVYTAAAPEFRPVRLTSVAEDDGIDLRPLQISDDGSVVIYIRGHAPGVGSRIRQPEWIANPASHPEGGRLELWAANTRNDRRPWRVAETTGVGLALSPDGRWVLHEMGGQIHRMAVDPGVEEPPSLDESVPLFRDFGSNGGAVWSPDGRRVAFVSQRVDHSFVVVYDVDARKLTYMTPGVDFDSAPVWSPDGARLAFLRRPGSPWGAQNPLQGAATPPAGYNVAKFAGGYDLSIWIADASTGEGRELWHNAPGDSLFTLMTRVVWSGDHILFEAEPNNWRHWFSVPVARPGAQAQLLTPGEAEVEHVSFSADGRWMYYTSNLDDIDRRNLWRVPVAGGPPEQLTRGPGLETWPAVLSSGNGVAITYAGPRQPLTVAMLPATGGEPRMIGASPPEQFPMSRHVEPTNVVITAADGGTFHNQLFLPPDLRPGERRPALVFIHGGPRTQMLLGYPYQAPHGFYHMAYAVNQYFVNKGYIVLTVNYRSGTGYGRRFREPEGYGGASASEYRDVIAAGRWLRERADVDPTRIGIWGLSYGGILTTQGLAENSDVFSSGVAIAGVRRQSVVANIDKWRSPVLLVHGDDDRNVDFSSTAGLVQVLRANHKPFELIVFPNDTHYLQIFERWIKTFEAADDFFDRTLIRKEPVRAEAAGTGG